MRLLITLSDQAWGGKHRYMYDFVEGLQARGYQVDLAVEQGGRATGVAAEAGLATVVVPSFAHAADEAADALREHVRAQGTPDLVCVTGRHDLAVVQKLYDAGELAGELVVFRHSAFPLAQDDASLSAVRRAAIVVATAWSQAEEQFADLLAENPSRLRVIGSGVRAQHFTDVDAADRAALRGELGIDDDVFAFAVVARLSWEKGVNRVIEGLATLDQDIDAVLLVVGDGEEQESLEKLAEQRGVADRVRFLGHRSDVVPVLVASDAVVLASTVPETGPLALKEAMAARRPVIASAIGGIPEFVTHQRNGLLVASDDELAVAMGTLATSAAATRALGQAARESMVEGHQLDQRVDHFAHELDLAAIRRLPLAAALDGLAWDDVRFRTETNSGFVFVPRTSQIAELDQAVVEVLQESAAQGRPALLTEAPCPDTRALADQLYRMGALIRPVPQAEAS